MGHTTRFLMAHPYAVLLVVVFLEQIGLPFPAVPFLLTAGALAAAGKSSLAALVAAALVATLVADLVWYEAGRRGGARVLAWICRISLEPDACVRKTQDVFARRGDRLLLWVKFVPGLSTVAPPLAGVLKMRPSRFLLFDGGGALLWVAAYLVLGYTFGNELERLIAPALGLGRTLTAILLGGIVVTVLWKWTARRLLLRELHIARITPEELHEKLVKGEDVLIVDLRHRLDFESSPESLPGAVWMDAAELPFALEKIPKDREVVFFCT